jgi:Ca-activated chloride channel family protein
MREAMALPHGEGTSRSFVVVTDGYISAEREIFEHIRATLGKANVFSFGIGSSVNRFLIEGVARAGMGEPFVVTEAGEAPAAAARFKQYIESPVLTDIEVTYDGFQAHDVEPISIPDLMARRPIVVHGKWKGSPTGRITVKGVAGNGRFAHVIDVAAAAAEAQQPALAYLWARTRIAALSDFNAGGETEADKAEITRLGLAYNLLTRHTSFVAVLEQVRNTTGDAARVAQPLPLPQGVSDAAVGGGGGGVGVGSEPPLWLLVAALGLAAAVLQVRARRRAR